MSDRGIPDVADIDAGFGKGGAQIARDPTKAARKIQDLMGLGETGAHHREDDVPKSVHPTA